MSGTLPFCPIPVDDYLELPQTNALLAATNENSKGNGPVASAKSFQLGEPTSGFHIGVLNHLGQRMGIVPEYHLEGDDKQAWGGKLKFGEHTITKNGIRRKTKRAAKYNLAELGVEAVNGTASIQNLPEKRNWVGLLQDFYANSLSSGVGGPAYTEYTIGPCFRCTCAIPARSEPFGSVSDLFTTKKATRASAAMEAMKFLIKQGLANSEGKYVRILKSRVKLEAISNILKPYKQKVHELCPLLGLVHPQYRFAPSAHAPAGSNILSGTAYFLDNPLISGPVGSITNVFGKENAKEECAKKVYRVLMQIGTEKDIFE